MKTKHIQQETVDFEPGTFISWIRLVNVMKNRFPMSTREKEKQQNYKTNGKDTAHSKIRNECLYQVLHLCVVHYEVFGTWKGIAADIYCQQLVPVKRKAVIPLAWEMQSMHVAKRKLRRNEIIRMSDSSASSIVTRFGTSRFSFVSIFRTFQKWQNIQEQWKKRENVFCR